LFFYGSKELGPVSLHFLAGPLVLVQHQDVTRQQEETVSIVGVSRRDSRWSSAFGGALRLAVVVPLARGVSLALGSATTVTGQRFSGEEGVEWQAVFSQGGELSLSWSR
jgi:hypothetical protein